MKNIDVVLSSRIRFARNIKDYPFASKLDVTSANEIIDKVGNVLEDYVKTDFSDIAPMTAQCYVESHRVSPEFVSSMLPHALYEKQNIKVMVCEEDHIRLQVIKKGFCLDEAYSEACECDDVLLAKLRIAYDEELGFLTHCPTNLGSAMRASVMLFLPALSMTGELNSLVKQLPGLGLTIRGMYGEGSEAQGYIYQISNSLTMGDNEEAIIERLSGIVSQLIDFERRAREHIMNGNIKNEDAVARAYGTMVYARLLSSAEFIELYAKVRLGISAGIIDNIEYDDLDALFTEVMPAHICKGERMTDTERDVKRAKTVKEKLMK